jgi:hypothetical protein
MKTGVSAALVAPIHPDSLKRGFTEIPKITEAFENWRKNPHGALPANRHEMIVSLMEAAIDYYTRQTRQEVPDYVRVAGKFLKWLAFKGSCSRICIISSLPRSAMDEDFGYHVHEFFRTMPGPTIPLIRRLCF